MATQEAVHLPSYEDIPDMGLYLEQVVHYICDYLSPLLPNAITGAMVSNYVKKKLLANPVHKLYKRAQIAKLFFIAVTKAVLSLDDLQILYERLRKKWGEEETYRAFSEGLQTSVEAIFSQKKSGRHTGHKDDEALLLESTLSAFTNKVYLERRIRALAGKNSSAGRKKNKE